jgi:RHS repeat-associated protein
VSATNGLTRKFQYLGPTADMRLAEMSHSMGPIKFFEFSYDYDLATGQIISWDEQAGSQPGVSRIFAYDRADQLVHTDVSVGGVPRDTLTYSYDRVGNRITVTRNGIATQCSYDPLDRQVSCQPQISSRSYEWDAEDRVVTIHDNTRAVHFTYDGFGRLASARTKDSGVEVDHRIFTWFGSRVRAIRAPSGNMLRELLPQGVKEFGGPSAGEYYYTRDHLGSVRELIQGLPDASAPDAETRNVKARFEFDDFGIRSRVAGTAESDVGFADYLFETSSLISVTPARMYDAPSGRWLSRDPTPNAEVLGSNLYNYVENNPLNLTDPLGLQPDWKQGIVGGWLYVLMRLVGAGGLGPPTGDMNSPPGPDPLIPADPPPKVPGAPFEGPPPPKPPEPPFGGPPPPKPPETPPWDPNSPPSWKKWEPKLEDLLEKNMKIPCFPLPLWLDSFGPLFGRPEIRS